MNKFLVALFALVFVSSAFAAPIEEHEFIVKIGVQPQSQVKFDEKENTNIGIAAGFEYYKYFGNIFALGAGALYELPREFKEDSFGNFSVSFLPLFVGVKARTPVQGLSNDYGFATLRLGYSPIMTSNANGFIRNESGGLYFAGGLGMNIDMLVIEAVYAQNKFSYTDVSSGRSEDATNSTITLFVGMKFE